MRVPIRQADGKTIRCPECGHDAPVRPAQMRVSSAPNAAEIVSAHGWWLVDCPRSGKKLYPTTTVVETVDEVSHAG